MPVTETVLYLCWLPFSFGLFDCAIEASRIALTYMTPVILLSDLYVANGAEPWKIPNVSELPAIDTNLRTLMKN